MKEIPLTQGKVALVDDEDFDRVNQYKWYVHRGGNNYYALTSTKIGGVKKIVAMHRFLLGLSLNDGILTDHRNLNGLDNRQNNIRRCNRAQNGQNTQSREDTTSRFKGVCWDKLNKKWESRIGIKNKTKYLGRFIQEELAALAYDFAAMRYHREFANFNF